MADATSTVNVRPPLWLPIVVVVIGGLFFLFGKNMEIQAPRENPMTITVTGDAKVSAPPDIATLSLGVTSGRQSSAKAATDTIKKSMTNIIAAVKKAGVEDKDIATESFWLNPEYDYTTGGQIPRGFQATQSLRIKVRDLDKVGDVLSAATGAGANQAGGITFSIDNPDDLKAQARVKAIEKAKAKAETLAENLGMRIVRVTGFAEDGMYPPQPYMVKSMELDRGGMGGGGDAMPIPSGEQDITSYVTLTYELR